MNEKLDKVTDSLIGNVCETMKNAVSRVVDSVSTENGSVSEVRAEFADMIGVSSEDIDMIMDGDLALMDFATAVRICIALGLTLNVSEPKPTREEAPRTTENRERRIPRHGFMPPFPPMPPFDEFPPRMGRHFYDLPRQERQTHQTQDPRIEHPAPSPFASMPRERLKDIIREHLWDSEIDINGATNQDLVKFLTNKDARMKAIRSLRRPNENNPQDLFRRKNEEEARARREHLKEELKKKGRELFGEFTDIFN